MAENCVFGPTPIPLKLNLPLKGTISKKRVIARSVKYAKAVAISSPLNLLFKLNGDSGKAT